MIARASFSKTWIDRQRAAFPGMDPQLIEKQIVAFELVALLRKSGKPFVFKGGTALLLLLPAPRRLSIDVDIVGEFSLADLASLAGASVFTRVDEHQRPPSAIPKRHYRFYYPSVVEGKESHILLDVLATSHGYPRLEQRPIRSPLFEVDEELTVFVPTVDGILGDKLTAFAPQTIGVPHGAGKSMEIIKQLLDIGELFDACGDLREISASYHALAREELLYRSMVVSVADVLQDTIDTAFLLTQSKLKGGIVNDRAAELLGGVKQIQGYLLGGRYRIEEARVSAAKAALLARLVQMGALEFEVKALRYPGPRTDDQEIPAIPGERAVLNRLRATQPEAFYYWALFSKF